MKVEPKAGPAVPFLEKNPGAASNVARENRARAIAAFNGGQAPAASQPQQNSVQEGTAVQNASRVSPEEMSGLRPSQAAAPGAEVTEEIGQTDTSEATSPPTAKVEEPLSPHFALLARKEKALRAEAQKLNAARQAFKAEQAALKTQAPAPSAAIDETKYIPKDRLSSDPISVLEELGYSTEDLANKLLNRQQIDPQAANLIAKLEAKLAKLEAAQDETKKTFTSAQEDSYKQAITAMEYEAEDLVNSDPEFATIKETGQFKEVVNLIKDVHEKGLPGKYRAGTLLSVEQAARLVEDELVNQWIEQHEKLSRLEKIQKRLKPATPAKPGNTAQGTQAQTSPATQNTTKTLTNSMGSGGKLSARERAIAVFKGEIKN